MKHLKPYLILESLDKTCKLSDDILVKLKSQNPLIEDVEDIMLEITHSWGLPVVPNFKLRDTSDSINQSYVELWSRKCLDYFGMDEGDFDDPDGDYKWAIDFINDVRGGSRKSLVLDIEYQYANDSNGFKPLKETPEQLEVHNDVKERLKSLGCGFDDEYTPGDSSLGQGLWKVEINVPVKLQLEGVLDKLDGFPNSVIKDFEQFVKDYNIDNTGREKLSSLIRNVRVLK